jgi:hypothetical protein
VLLLGGLREFSDPELLRLPPPDVWASIRTFAVTDARAALKDLARGLTLHGFREDGRPLDPAEPLPLAESRVFYALPILAAVDAGIASAAGSAVIRGLADTWLPAPYDVDDREFLCYLAYFRRSGKGSAEVLRGLERFAPFPPLLLAFRKLIERAELTALDAVVIRESLRIYVNLWAGRSGGGFLTCMRAVGFVFDNLAALANLDPGAVADVAAPSDGPLAPVSQFWARGRCAISVVREGDRRLLLLGRLPTGEHRLFDPTTNATAPSCPCR